MAPECDAVRGFCLFDYTRVSRLKELVFIPPRGSDSPPDCHSLPHRSFAKRFAFFSLPPSYSPFGLITLRPYGASHFTSKKKSNPKWVAFVFGCGDGIWTTWPPGYEPDELPGCSTPRYIWSLGAGDRDRTGTMLSHHGILSPGRLPVPPHRQVTPRDLRPFGSHCLL